MLGLGHGFLLLRSSVVGRRLSYQIWTVTLKRFLPTSGVVHDLDVVGISITPHKTKTPLAVDPDTVLPLPLAAQGFPTVPRRCCQIAQLHGAVQLAKFSTGDPFDGSKATSRLPVVKSPGFRATERPDHPSILYRIAFNVEQ
jgi:hypothetical protein